MGIKSKVRSVQWRKRKVVSDFMAELDSQIAKDLQSVRIRKLLIETGADGAYFD